MLKKLILSFILANYAVGLLAQDVIPALDCNDAIENPKFYQESCKNDTECFGSPNSMVCKNQRCLCVDNFEPQERFTGETSNQIVCVPSPRLFERCNSTCQKPAVCSPYTGVGSDGKTKVCLCQDPFKYEDGSCFLNCSTDEKYLPAKFKCIKKCQINEIEVDEKCETVSNLGDKCDVDIECKTAYSECKWNACVCKSGFKAQNFVCQPRVVTCPSGEPLKEDESTFKKCKLFFVDIDDDGDNDGTRNGDNSNQKPEFIPQPGANRKKAIQNCPKGNFCMIPSENIYSKENATGYCCPTVKSGCPVGLPHPTAVCGSDIDSDASKTCPDKTHFCFSYMVNGKQRCCPKTCPEGFIKFHNSCYPTVGLSEKCSIKQQCSGSFSDCINGVCSCVDGAIEKGSVGYRYCSKECNDDEVLFEDRCMKRLKLADSCSSKQEVLCPEYAFCNSNKLCACRCGMFTLADNVCAPPPICRPPTIFPLLGSEAFSEVASPPIPRISNEELEKLLKNVTFCNVYNKTAPYGVKVVDKCPNGQYCSYYITNLGLCCSKPKPFCQFGNNPTGTENCDYKDPLSCGLDDTCFKYLNPVDQSDNNNDYSVCCPKSPRLSPSD